MGCGPEISHRGPSHVRSGTWSPAGGPIAGRLGQIRGRTRLRGCSHVVGCRLANGRPVKPRPFGRDPYTLEDETSWPLILPQLQSAFNNVHNASIQKTPNELVYGFRTNKLATLLELQKLDSPNLQISDYQPARVDAQDALSLAQPQMKHYYDSRHAPIFFNKGDWVKLRLHCGYHHCAISQPKINA